MNMNSTLTYNEEPSDRFNLDHPFGPLFVSFRSWLWKNGFDGITEFLVCVFFSILGNL